MNKKIRSTVKKNISFKEKILKILSKNTNKLFNYKQLAQRFSAKDTQSKNTIISELKTLSSQKIITETTPGSYYIKSENKNYYTGTIDMTSKKTAYFICKDLESDTFIPTQNINHALDGDTVKVYIYNRRKRQKPEGEVVEIIQRKKTNFVGVIDIQKNFAFVKTSNPKMYTDIFIQKNKLGEAKQGDVVLVKIEDWLPRAASPFGSVIKVLGQQGEHNTEIHAILAEYGLPTEFPPEVELFAQKIDTSIKKSEIKKRKDFREILTFTIDPKDAKDFDDALSFQKLKNGNYEIGIHIADVSHYLQENTTLDDEAYQRATSIYLVDRVVPMLPEVLSNFACSLRPNEEKYTFSAVFELNENSQIINQFFGRTIIKSNQRFSYEEAQYVIENKSNTIQKEISITGQEYQITDTIKEAILKMNELAIILRKNRMKDGAISFDKVEVKFNLNQNAEPEGIYFKISKDANHLIEEFMLLANRKVAEFIGKQKKTFIYRIHDKPNEEKLLSLQNIINKFGYKIDFTNKKIISKTLNNLLTDVTGKKEQNLVETLAIRSMSKAKYSTQNIGHYGLAFDYYSHFTSPIRRYPDVITHRLLQHYIENGKSVDEQTYETKCLHASSMEILATQAERDSIKYMQVKYMQNHQDQEFVGIISGVTERGIFVEIVENKCEGMCRTKDIKDDYYIFDEKQYALVGANTKNILQLGDEIIVKVKSADLVKKQLDFIFITKK